MRDMRDEKGGRRVVQVLCHVITVLGDWSESAMTMSKGWKGLKMNICHFAAKSKENISGAQIGAKLVSEILVSELEKELFGSFQQWPRTIPEAWEFLVKDLWDVSPPFLILNLLSSPNWAALLTFLLSNQSKIFLAPKLGPKFSFQLPMVKLDQKCYLNLEPQDVEYMADILGKSRQILPIKNLMVEK